MPSGVNEVSRESGEDSLIQREDTRFAVNSLSLGLSLIISSWETVSSLMLVFSFVKLGLCLLILTSFYYFFLNSM